MIGIPRKITALMLITFSSVVQADVRFVDAEGEFRTVIDRAHIEISGKINAEDAAAVDRLIGVAAEKTFFRSFSGSRKPVVLLNSSGGDLQAAIKIGRTLRKNAAWIWVAAPSKDRAICASACVFILAGGVERNVADGSRILLHRPYFDPTHYANLSSEESQSQYRRLTEISKLYLRDMGMPDLLFERMLRVPSQKAKLLSQTELVDLRLVGKDPAFEEWDRANAQKHLGDDKVKRMEGFLECENSGTPLAVCEKKWKLKVGK